MRLLVAGKVLCLTIAVLTAPGTASACGYHDPKMLQQGLMNYIFPDSLHVRGAISSLQRTGHLAMVDGDRFYATGAKSKEIETAMFWKAARTLHSIGREIDNRRAQQHGISLVLIEKMLWTRFPIGAGPAGSNFELDVGGSKDGDLVVVTGEPVIFAIGAGNMSISEAIEMGAMRVYGEDVQMAAFVADYGEIGAKMLVPSSNRALFSTFLKKRPTKQSVPAPTGQGRQIQ